ncbi:rho GTPase-activating protein 26-like [Corticium candelabrum]|uniref:rho GTPase-activating protein 26-like n=1 Tax=Corticium candelabrum TaxID=121492 RepID=UPI002E271BC8|nr:rho GTPase-activating protein 26-like [Corticium candelabrum]
MVLRPLEFTDCLHDSPFFRENLQAHEKELENTSEAIKGLLRECRHLLGAMKELSKAQKSFADTLSEFTFEFIGSDQQTEKEAVICGAFQQFAQIVGTLEEHRELLMESAQARLLTPLERFRKDKIQGTKEYKKAFDRQSDRCLSLLDRHLALSPKKKDTQLSEADITMEQEQKKFRQAAMEYVKVLLDVQERKKFEFVEPLLGFMTDQMTFYHSAYETGQEYKELTNDLQVKLQDVRQVWQESQEYTESLMKATEEKGQHGDTRSGQFARQGYLYQQKERKLGGITSGLSSSKCFCQYMKSNSLFVMFPISDHSKGKFSNPESLVVDSCVRRMTDSIDKRFCFNITAGERTLVMQALSNDDRRLWLEVLGGKEPVYMETSKLLKVDAQSGLTTVAYQFVHKCIETIERRGIEDEGLYRVAGVSSRVQKLTTSYEKNRLDKVSWNDVELEVKTITSAVKNHFRSMPEPLLTYDLHQEFLNAAKNDHETTIANLQQLVQQLPGPSQRMLKLLMQHLYKVAAHAHKNRMLPSNLGVVFGPTLMRPAEESVASIMDIKYQNEVIEIMIKEYTNIFAMASTSSVSFASPKLGKKQAGSLSGVEPVSLISLSSSSSTTSMPAVGQIPGASSPSEISPPMSPSSVEHTLTQSQGARRQSGPVVAAKPKLVTGPRSIQKFPRQPLLREVALSDPADLVSSHGSHFANQGALDGTSSPTGHGPPPFDPPVPPQQMLGTKRSPVVAYQQPVIPAVPLHPHSRANPVVSHYAQPTAVLWKSSADYLHSDLPRAPDIPPRQHERQAQTLYDCHADNVNELSFEAGQIVQNVRPSKEPGWLQGTINGRSGLIPENYVQMI